MPRWHTYEPGIPTETSQRLELQGQINEWWKSFTDKAPEIVRLFSRQCEEWDLADWMQGHLNAISPDLMWEFGPGIPAGHRLIITPEAERHLRPLVDQILGSAPSLPGWSFHGWRLPENLTMVRDTIKARTGHSWEATGCRMEAGDWHRVHVTFAYPDKILSHDAKLAWNQAFVACETLFGEEQMDKWCGVIETAPAAPGDLPLEESAAAFARTKNRIIAERPQDLCFQRSETATGTLWKLKPDKADDYPGQLDLFVGKSIYPAVWTAAHTSEDFHSIRFSDREIFCYLKLDGKEGIEKEGFADKSEIEDAVDAALIPAGLGCQIGGGTGLRYSYIDLALTDWRAAMQPLREVLRRGRVPKRSWLLFFDSEWAHEWMGVYPDTPPPPGIG